MSEQETVNNASADEDIRITEGKADKLKDEMKSIVGEEVYEMGVNAHADASDGAVIASLTEMVRNASKAVEDAIENGVSDDAGDNMDDETISDKENESDGESENTPSYEHVTSFDEYRRYLEETGFDFSAVEEMMYDNYDNAEDAGDDIDDELSEITPIYTDPADDVDARLAEIDVVFADAAPAEPQAESDESDDEDGEGENDEDENEDDMRADADDTEDTDATVSDAKPAIVPRSSRRHKSKASFISAEQIIPRGDTATSSYVTNDDSFPSEQEFDTIATNELMEMLADIEVPDDDLINEVASIEDESDGATHGADDVNDANDVDDGEGWLPSEEPDDIYGDELPDETAEATEDELAEQKAMDEYYSEENMAAMDEEDAMQQERFLEREAEFHDAVIDETEQIMLERAEKADCEMEPVTIAEQFPIAHDSEDEDVNADETTCAAGEVLSDDCDNIDVSAAASDKSLISVEQVVTSRGSHAENEDFIYADGKTVIVADGATTVDGMHAIPATWVVERFVKRFPENLSRREEETSALYAERTCGMEDDEKMTYRDDYIRSMMTQALDKTIASIEHDYEDEFGELADAFYPSAAAAIAHTYDGATAFLIIGDCSIIAFLDDDCELVVGQDRELLRLDGECHEYISALSRLLGCTYREAAEHDGTKALFACHRRLMNEEGGYTVVAPNMPHIDEHAMIIQENDGVACVLMHTDGFDSTYDDEELDVEAPGADLEAILHELREREAKDSDFSEMPRFKMSDDASAIRFGLVGSEDENDVSK